MARAIEHETAETAIGCLLWAALASIAASLALQMLDRKHDALFVGQWAPTILLLGVYNKLVKQLGSDQRLSRWGRLWPNAARNCASDKCER